MNVDNVVIVGAGVAGASAAYHLALAGVKNVVVLECGTAGHGSLNPVKDCTKTEEQEEGSVFRFAHRSGSAVMPSASTIKMIVRLFASSATDFIEHHGIEGAKKYIKITTSGLETEKEIAKSILPNAAEQLRSFGSLYLAYEKDEAEFRKEFDILKEIGCNDIEWWEKDQLHSTPGCSKNFHCGIFFPKDAIINSSVYSAALLSAATAMGAVRVVENCSPVVSVSTIPASHASSPSSFGEEETVGLTVLQDGTRIESRHIVLATGGLFTNDPNLSGIVRPCWSYLVSVPHPEMTEEALDANSATFSDGTPKFSMNFFSWGFTHDWSWTEGAVRISGEDHFSALKPPKAPERCRNLAHWTQEAYGDVFPTPAVETVPYAWQYGVYSETPDSVPVVGRTSDASKVCYLLGCNAWGQAVLSYTATLVPGLLGYTPMTEEQSDLFELVSVRRFALLPSVLDGCK